MREERERRERIVGICFLKKEKGKVEKRKERNKEIKERGMLKNMER